MLLSAVSVLVVAQSSSEIPEGLINNPVHPSSCMTAPCAYDYHSHWFARLYILSPLYPNDIPYFLTWIFFLDYYILKMKAL